MRIPLLRALLVALCATLALGAAPAPVPAHQPRALSFPVHETFDATPNLGTTTGNASYPGGGWLRLTSAATGQAGSWEMNDSFSTNLGIVAEFTYASYGGSAFDGKRGDGLAFFLADGSAANGTGASGGGLGYACAGSANSCNRSGVPGAFLGIGLDEFGNFSSPDVGNGGPGARPNAIALRGGGNGTSGYRYGTAVNGPGGTVETGSRANYRTVRVQVLPRGGRLLVSVWSDSGPGTALTKVISDYDVSAIANQPALPATLKVGFSGSTGGATNIHEIGDLTINVPANLSITKSGTATIPASYGPATYTVTVTNSDINDVEGAVIRDTVPALTGVTWTCTATTGSACRPASGSGNTINTLADLRRNGSVTYTILGNAPNQPVTFTNTATVTAPGNRVDTDPADNTASVTTTVTALADVAVTKAGVGSGPVRPGDQFDYRITATDRGPSDTTNVRVTDTLPAGLTFVSSPDGCTASGQTVTCPTRAALAAGSSAGWTIRVKLDPAYTGNGSDLGNRAVVSHDITDPDTANNTSPAAPPPGGVTAPQADLRTTKVTVTNTPVAPGESYEYTVTVTNQGPSVARQVRATDVLPPALRFVSSSSGCTAVTATRTVTCGPVATLTVGAAVTWTFRVALDAAYSGDGTDLRNTATADADTADPDRTNNSGTAAPPGGKVKSPTADLEFDKKSAS
ncbi:DUF11 domain-containing protein [Streptomyces paludis]|uniref:DUF11 domain-containing protein n=1 Tax=Streptomyces paludis TaxID=2282738 RepID=A0A345HQX7_9ACTN|nr:DUF11 domain-containing protein [Streptomyces paludis]AXG79101.1 DUF11 domain-containing protein [Streptomyces paludis]